MINFPNMVSAPIKDLATGRDSAKDSPERIQSAAKQFEALLIGQMLKSMKGTDENWLGTGEDDDAGGTATDMGQDFLAQSLASNGGFGLAKSIAADLSRNAADLSKK
jgi:peptidoglycan hydrolase FlgJ